MVLGLSAEDRIQDFLSDNRLQQRNVEFQLQKVACKIAFFELLLSALSASSGRGFSYYRKHPRKRPRYPVGDLVEGKTISTTTTTTSSSSFVPRRLPRFLSLSTRAKPIRVSEILAFINPWIPSKWEEWDMYQICVVANRAVHPGHAEEGKRETNIQKEKPWMFPIDPLMIRRALELKAQSLLLVEKGKRDDDGSSGGGGEEEKEVEEEEIGGGLTSSRVVMINLLLPPDLPCKERIPIRPTGWNKLFMQESIESVAQHLRVSPSALKESIKKILLDSVSRDLMGINFEKISIDICGSEKLSSAIFFLARELCIRPQIKS